jgi:hypothetical protein
MSQPELNYVVDTSSFIHAYQRSYPPDILPALWEEKFDLLIAHSRLISPVDVLEELRQKHDALYEWASVRESMFFDLDHFENQLKDVMASFPRLVDTKKGKSGADPMVISLALSRTPPWTVVTEESFGTETSPRIPFVCDQRKLRCINMLQLLRDQHWSF